MAAVFTILLAAFLVPVRAFSEAGSATAMTDTVRVTGDRLPGRGLSSPVAISEVLAADLQTERQIGLDEALDTVPGVIAQSRSGGQDVRITIRGFGARGAGERSNAGTTRGIRIQLDGFPLTEPDGRTSLDFADMGSIERVRVVRSNASALFGSASGGLVDLFTHSRIGPRSFQLRTAFGSFGLQRQHAIGTLPLGSADARLSVSNTRFDGWRRHSRSTTTTLQTSILTQLSRSTDLGVFLAATRNKNEQPGALTTDEFAADPRLADPTFVTRNYRRENSIGRLGVRLQHGWQKDDLLSVSAFVEPKVLHRAERNRFRDFTRVHTGGGVSYRWQVPVARDLDLRWTNGVDDAYQDGTVLFYNLGPNGTRASGPAPFANKREAINTLGIFSQLEAHPTAKLNVSAGAHYDLVRFIFEDFQNPALDAKRSMNRVSPRVAAAFRIRPSQSVYLALSSGIEAPAYNEIDPPAPFDTLTGLNPFLKLAHSFTLELGTKGTQALSPDGKSFFRYDLALYGLDVYNDIIPFDDGAYYSTAGKSRRLGVEVGGELRLASGVYTRLACSVSRNRYVEYRNQLGNFADNQSAGIAPFILDEKLGWEAPFGAFVEAGVHSLGQYFADDANTNRVPAYGIADITVGAHRQVGGGRLDAFVGCDNIFDARYVGSVFINGVGGRFIEPGMERSFLFGLKYGGD